MDQKPQLPLENLVRCKRDLDRARERFDRQMAECLAVYSTTEIARAIGLGKPAISNRRRRLKDGGT